MANGVNEVAETSKFRSRKWMSMLGIVALSTAMLFAGKIAGDLWVDVVKWVYGIFASANVINKGVESKVNGKW